MPYYRRNIYILSTTIFLAAASWNQVMPFLPLFLRELGAGENLFHWVGIVFAAQSVASILAMPFWGKMGDNYGRKVMVIRAGLCLTGIYLGMSFCNAPWQLALFRFLNGALTGFIPGSITLIATNTPQEAAPRAVATAQTASAVGLIIGPAVGGLLAAVAGYRAAMQVSGAAVLFSTLLVWWLVKEPNKVSPGEKTSLLEDFLISLRTPIMAAIMLSVMVQGMFGAAINPVLTLHLESIGRNPASWIAGVVFALPALAFVLSAHRWTRLGERVGFDKAIILGLFGTAASAFALTLAHGIWSFAILYFIAGIWLSAISPATAAMTCTRVDEAFRGRAYGMQMSAGMVGALIAPIVGSQLGAAFGIPSIFAFVGATFIAGSLLFRMLIYRPGGSGKWEVESRK